LSRRAEHTYTCRSRHHFSNREERNDVKLVRA
jgi:hypothetical protein